MFSRYRKFRRCQICCYSEKLVDVKKKLILKLLEFTISLSLPFSVLLVLSLFFTAALSLFLHLPFSLGFSIVYLYFLRFAKNPVFPNKNTGGKKIGNSYSIFVILVRHSCTCTYTCQHKFIFTENTKCWKPNYFYLVFFWSAKEWIICIDCYFSLLIIQRVRESVALTNVKQQQCIGQFE
jgi:hypothetical protein